MNASTLARRLHQAILAGEPIEQPPEGSFDLAGGYAVQRELLALCQARGETLIGVKMAFTGLATLQRLKLASPALGHLTDAMQVVRGRALALTCQRPQAEAELAFLLGEDLDGDEGNLSPEQLRGAIAGFAPAIEIAGSRYRALRFSVGDVVGDNASGFAFAVGAWTPLPATLDLAQLELMLEVNGEVIARGKGEAIFGDPLASLAEAARLAARFATPLRKGQIVLAGTATPPQPIAAGDRVRATTSQGAEARLELAP